VTKELYQEVRDLIIQDRRGRLYDGYDISATVLEELADMMAYEIDQVSEPDEAVRLVIFALQQAIYYLRYAILHRWSSDPRDLCSDVMMHLEMILDRKRDRLDRLQDDFVTRAPPSSPEGGADIVDAIFVANDDNADKPS